MNKEESMEKLKPISPDEFIVSVINHLLGENWYVVDPLGAQQILAIALDEIKQKYKKAK